MNEVNALQGSLLEETLDKLHESHKTFDDILWIGSNEFYIPVELFIRLSNQGYDSGYGAPLVAQDLLIVGNDWWLERHEYDGSEWWEYKETPKKPKEMKIVKTLFNDGWDSLSKGLPEDK